LGYDELHWVHLWYLDKFIEASNAANYALLEGKTYQQAYDAGIAKYTEKFNELSPIDASALDYCCMTVTICDCLATQTLRPRALLSFLQ
jgi:hypothetical protein